MTRIRHGDKPLVETESGRAHASKVVLAGNAYLGNTEPKIRHTIIPAGSYMIATEPLPESLAKDLSIDYEWGGNVAISINRIPQFGRIKNNTYYAQGYSGHGVAPTHLACCVLPIERTPVGARL